ncbi:MAG: tRNA (adenosine(37)-N6)-threonylcarbamoyltransferase complex ATPase subunit type 1 TsaE [Patescibacteria group bacterium]
MIYSSQSSKQTKELAANLASEISKTRFKKNQAIVLALKGNLGSGKTTFTQGFLRGLGVKKKITSPTFVIFKRYELIVNRYKFVYHIDCYRIKKSQELLILGIKEIFDNPKNIVLIEWPEKIKKILPKERFNLRFEYGKKENERSIMMSDY